jgi:hypothetical protein
MKSLHVHSPSHRQKFILISLLVLSLALVQVIRVAAQSGETTPPQVQITQDHIADSTSVRTYEITNLSAGDTLYIYAEGTSGDLDPFIALLSKKQMDDLVVGSFWTEVQKAIDAHRDPISVVAKFSNANFSAWDDDSGDGFSAALEFTVPDGGNYYLIVLSSPFSETFGDYKLTAGLNAPQVLNGNATANGDPFLTLVQTKGAHTGAVQKITASVGGENKPVQQHRLQPFDVQDTLYVYVETIEGDLIPQVILRAYGSKPVRSANYEGDESTAYLEYTFPEEVHDYIIEIVPKANISGTYTMLVGKNDPAVRNGNVEPYGEAVLVQPINASVGVKLQQITGIDQKSENYGAVVSTMIAWNDPALAFRPDECECETKIFTAKEFVSYVTKDGIIWPAFTYRNQQNNRWIQNDFVAVQPNGDARYFERFTTIFQAPDFDFRQFPFDKQTFFIRIDSLYPADYVTFTPSNFTEIGTQLGEEEWYITDHKVEVLTEPGSTGKETASFIFRFYASRHLAFYIYRILLPLGLIILVAWITFFMEDYGKRVDATTANLLLFIAFNFTIAGDLPRLGYLTFMDTLLASAFGLSVLVVAYNVALKRMEKENPDSWLFQLDKYMLWVYPLMYAIVFGGVTWYFFWR